MAVGLKGGRSDLEEWFCELNCDEHEFPTMCALARLREFLVSDEARLLNRGMDRGVAEIVLQALYLQQQNSKVYQLAPSLDGLNHFKALQADRVAKIAGLFKLER
jgi:hypothetical protein